MRYGGAYFVYLETNSKGNERCHSTEYKIMIVVKI